MDWVIADDTSTPRFERALGLSRPLAASGMAKQTKSQRIVPLGNITKELRVKVAATLRELCQGELPAACSPTNDRTVAQGHADCFIS